MRELPPGASAAPVTERRNRVLALGLAACAVPWALLAVYGSRVLTAAAGATLTNALLLAQTARQTRRLLSTPSPLAATSEVEVTEVRRFPHEVRLRRPGGVPVWWPVRAPLRGLRGIPAGTAGTRYAYEDGIAVVVLGDRTLWCEAAHKGAAGR